MLTAHLNQKLEALLPKDAKFAVAYSGGGDSTALVHALKDHPQKGPVYIVDHALREGSNAEAKAAKQFALTCEYDVKVLKWKHNSPNSPKSAIQEKARKARYALMGQECRDAGIEYLLTAHNKDDQAETLLMRYDRRTDWRGAAGMSELAYAPLWPELAMVNIARPLLDVSREELRNYNRTYTLKWAEDSSNENRDYTRIRARDYLRDKPDLVGHLLGVAQDLRVGKESEQCFLVSEFNQAAKLHPEGYVTISKVPVPELLLHILRAVGGTEGVINRAKIKALLDAMRDPAFKGATLGGAQIVRGSDAFIICRDPVAVRGRKDGKLGPRAKEISLTSHKEIWDDRFVVSCGRGSYTLTPWAKLDVPPSMALKKHIKSLPSVVRPTTPVIRTQLEAYAPHEIPDLRLISLIQSRLEAALGTKLL